MLADPIGAGVVGLVVGSFLATAARRLPVAESLMGDSHCPHCAAVLLTRDNIPLLSFIWLRGRCRTCHRPISLIHPLTELVTGALFAVAFLAVPPWDAAVACVAISLAVVCSLIDLTAGIVPRQLTWGAAVVSLAVMILGCLSRHHWLALEHAAIAGGIAAGVMGSAFFIAPGAIGYGDVRYAPVQVAAIAYVGAPSYQRLGVLGGIWVLVAGVWGLVALVFVQRNVGGHRVGLDLDEGLFTALAAANAGLAGRDPAGARAKLTTLGERLVELAGGERTKAERSMLEHYQMALADISDSPSPQRASWLRPYKDHVKVPLVPSISLGTLAALLVAAPQVHALFGLFTGA